jgi:hypothetical protein
MSFGLKVLAIILLTIAIMFFTKKIVENIFNLNILLRRKNYYDVSNQKHGIVLNKKTKKLEADQSIILPF